MILGQETGRYEEAYLNKVDDEERLAAAQGAAACPKRAILTEPRNFATGSKDVERLFEELIEQQRKKVFKLAQEIIPNITGEDILQPNDYPQLENNPYFRYEEGVLEGLQVARMAFLARPKVS